MKRGFDFLLHYLFCIVLLLTPFCFNYGNKNTLKFYLYEIKKESLKNRTNLKDSVQGRTTKDLETSAEWHNALEVEEWAATAMDEHTPIVKTQSEKAGGTTNIFFSSQ